VLPHPVSGMELPEADPCVVDYGCGQHTVGLLHPEPSFGKPLPLYHIRSNPQHRHGGIGGQENGGEIHDQTCHPVQDGRPHGILRRGLAGKRGHRPVDPQEPERNQHRPRAEAKAEHGIDRAHTDEDKDLLPPSDIHGDYPGEEDG